METAGWLVSLGGLVLTAAQFGYRIWRDRKEDRGDGEPPTAAAA